jgi:hypothetical protein
VPLRPSPSSYSTDRAVKPVKFLTLVVKLLHNRRCWKTWKSWNRRVGSGVEGSMPTNASDRAVPASTAETEAASYYEHMIARWSEQHDEQMESEFDEDGHPVLG